MNQTDNLLIADIIISNGQKFKVKIIDFKDYPSQVPTISLEDDLKPLKKDRFVTIQVLEDK